MTYPSGTPLETTRKGTLALEGLVDKVTDLAAESAMAGAYLGQLSGYINNAAVGQIDLFLNDNRAHTTAYWADYLQRESAEARAGCDRRRGSGYGHLRRQRAAHRRSRSSVDGDPEPCAAKVVAALTATKGAIDVTTSAVADAPQVDVTFDRDARERSTPASAPPPRRYAPHSAAISRRSSPDPTVSRTSWSLSDQRAGFARSDLADSDAPNDSSIIHVGDIAHFVQAPAPPMIMRINRQSVVYIGADLAPGATLSNVQRDFARRLAALKLPVDGDVAPEAGGNQRTSRTRFRNEHRAASSRSRSCTC